MQAKQKITLFYIGIALFAVAILGISFWLRRQGQEASDSALARQTVSIRTIGEIAEPITLTDQNGEKFNIDRLKGKVWTVNAFFASCPQCVDNYSDHLVRIHQLYKDHPDFHMVSLSVDPRDTPERVRENLSRLAIDFDHWTFLMGDQKKVRAFLEKELQFAATKERKGEEAAEKGAYAHDMGVMVVDRDMKIRLKKDLFSTASFMPEALEPSREAMIETIGALLAGKDERPRGKSEVAYDNESPVRVRTGEAITP